MTVDPERNQRDGAEAERRRRYRERRHQMRVSAIGFQFVFSIAIGALGGSWLDRKLGTEPWLLLVGIVLGAVAAYRDLVQLTREHERIRRDEE